MAAHATLSPSSAERWTTCTASVAAIAAADLPKDDGSSYALEGTLAHELAEIEGRYRWGQITRRGRVAPMRAWTKKMDAEYGTTGAEEKIEEMVPHVRSYLDEIERVQESLGPEAEVLFEQRLDTGVPGCWGTSDAVLFSSSHVAIVDLKYGAGVRVEAEGNAQLRLYALGALREYGDVLGETETVSMTVVQPRMGHVSTATLTAAELRSWRDEVVVPAVELVGTDQAVFRPSLAACRWCPLSGLCRAQLEQSTAEDFGDLLDPGAAENPSEGLPLLTPGEVAAALERLPLVKSWAKDLEAAALEMAYTRGVSIPGWKVVRSGGRRVFVDEAAAIDVLTEHYPREKVVRESIETLTKLTKVVGGEKQLTALVGELLKKTEGREALAPAADPRPGVTKNMDATNDFEGVNP